MSNFQGIRKLREGKLSNPDVLGRDSSRKDQKKSKHSELMLKLHLARELQSKELRIISERRSKAGSQYLLEPSLQNFVLGGSARDHHARDRPSISQQGGSVSARHEALFVGTQTKPLASRSRRESFQREAITRQDARKDEGVHKGSFVFQFVVGKGGFGKVWKVMHKKNGKIMAMKEMLKAKIIEKKSVKSVMNQRQLIGRLYHPFMVNIIYAFQDRETLYLGMDYVNGGDLRYHIGRMRRFRQNQSKFFIACLLVVLEYLHVNNIIHRDIKPENLVLDDRGYLRLTDLGISREYRPDNAADTSGTPGYMAPEVICRQNHSFESDFFAIGVMAYELMLGRRPYVGRSRKEIREHILSKQVQVRAEEVPRGWSCEAQDFINRMIQRNPSRRLGYNGIDQVKEHAWFRDINWGKLLRKEIQSPYTPIPIEHNYEDYKGQISEDSMLDNPEESALMLRNPEVQRLFDGYSYDRTTRALSKQYYSNTDSTESDERQYRLDHPPPNPHLRKKR